MTPSSTDHGHYEKQTIQRCGSWIRDSRKSAHVPGQMNSSIETDLAIRRKALYVATITHCGGAPSSIRRPLLEKQYKRLGKMNCIILDR
jgi:hypothetical protein